VQLAACLKHYFVLILSRISKAAISRLCKNG